MIPTRLVDTDSDGTPTVGTIHNNAWLQLLQNAIDAIVQDVLTTSTVTGSQNNYAPTGFSTTAGHCTLPWNGASDATFSGFTAGINGQRVTWINLSSTKVAYFKHANASSSAGNKFQNVATTGDTPIAAGGSATFEYDTSSGTGVWRLIAHEQGAEITATYAVGNFTGSGGWTVDAGDVTTMSWKLRGKDLIVKWALATTTVVTGTTLSIGNGAWGSFTAAKSVTNPTGINDNNTGTAIGLASVAAAATTIQLLKQSGANWANSTNLTSINGEIAFEVT